MIFTKKLQALFNPGRYHGWGRKRSYFEGWYYKVISADQQSAFAFIPGIAMDANGKKEAFIQVLDGKKMQADFIRFSSDQFNSSAHAFKTTIANNTFELDRIDLHTDEVKGSLQFSNLALWPSKWYSPGIMGPYTFVPFMECYHGILSMDHKIMGTLEIKGQRINFDEGRGYIEKDWGHSFPSAYFWMQSNHFSKERISFKASVAKIPWMRSSFVGFIAGLYLDGKLYQFTTYNGTKLIESFADQHVVELIMENKKHHLEINAIRDHATELAAPIQGFMDGRISESMTSIINVKLMDKKSQQIIFSDSGQNAGLEVAGNIDEIMI